MRCDVSLPFPQIWPAKEHAIFLCRCIKRLSSKRECLVATLPRRAISLDPNCGWARGKADVLYVADTFAVTGKVNELLAAGK